MTTSREDFEALMPEPKYRIRSVLGRHIDIKAEGYDARKDDPLYTADQMRAMFEAATERAALIAQAHLDGEAAADQCEADWNAAMGWDWACQKIRNAIRGTK